MWHAHPHIKISPSFIITFFEFRKDFSVTHILYSHMDKGFGGRIMLTEKRVCTACPNWYRSSQREPWWTFWGFLWRRFSHKIYLLICLCMIYPSINMYFFPFSLVQHNHQESYKVYLRAQRYTFQVNYTWVFPVPVFSTDEPDQPLTCENNAACLMSWTESLLGFDFRLTKKSRCLFK